MIGIEDELSGGFMRRSWAIVVSAVLLLMFIAGSAQAVEIFVWRHDNRLRVVDPVLHSSLTATEAVMRTLDRLDIDYVTGNVLPDDLDRYDVVITCLSFYCPG